MRLETIIDMPPLMSGIWKRFGVHMFEGKVTLDDMDVIEKRSEAWHGKIRGKLVEMVVIFPSEARMTSEERARMAGIIKRWESARIASATVILAQGLVGATHRAVLTGLQMIAPPPHPTKVFGVTADAVKWLSPHVHELCGPESTPEALVSAVDELAQRFATRPTRPASKDW